MLFEWTAALLLVIGAAFMLLAAVGIVRMPDLYTRLSTSTKATTLGVACLALAAALHFDQLEVTTRALLIILFFLLTSPVAGHLISRAAYLCGSPLWEGSVCDEMAEAQTRPASEQAESASRLLDASLPKPTS